MGVHVRKACARQALNRRRAYGAPYPGRERKLNVEGASIMTLGQSRNTQTAIIKLTTWAGPTQTLNVAIGASFG
jgi:hypothetical protein